MFGNDAISGREIDHVNGDGLNNKRSNLRLASRSENLSNRGKTIKNTSGYKGVMASSGKWMAQIKVHRCVIRLGVFESPEDAARVYDEAARKYHGEFAVTTSNLNRRINRLTMFTSTERYAHDTLSAITVMGLAVLWAMRVIDEPLKAARLAPIVTNKADPRPVRTALTLLEMSDYVSHTGFKNSETWYLTDRRRSQLPLPVITRHRLFARFADQRLRRIRLLDRNGQPIRCDRANYVSRYICQRNSARRARPRYGQSTCTTRRCLFFSLF